MKIVAFAELIIMVRVTLGAVTFQNSLLSPVIYAHFLRQRWYQSKFTREAVAIVNARVLAFIQSPGKPPVLIQVYGQFTGIVSRWVGSAMAAPAAGANGARRQ